MSITSTVSHTLSKSVAFIDRSIANYQTVLEGLPAAIEVQFIDAGQDGLLQLRQWAETHSGYDVIHIFSHGGPGRLHLGSSTLSADTLSARAEDLRQLGAALGEEGDLLIYGCDVAAGETGQAFVTQLAELTGADVAASEDATGAAVLGGNWELEYNSGVVEANTLSPIDYSYVLVYYEENYTKPADGGVVEYAIRSTGSYLTHVTEFSSNAIPAGVTVAFRIPDWTFPEEYKFTSTLGGVLQIADNDPRDMNTTAGQVSVAWRIIVDWSVYTTGTLNLQYQPYGFDFDVITYNFITNTAPVAGTSGSVTIAAGATLQTSHLNNTNTGSSDADGDTLTYTLTGTTVSAPTDAAQPGWKGEQTVGTQTFTVSDGKGGSANGSITVKAVYANDAPYFTSTPVSRSITDTDATDTFSNLTGTITGADPDTIDTRTFSVNGNSSQVGAYGTLSITTVGAYTYTPNATAINALTQGATPQDTFTIRISDGTAQATQTFTVNLTGANDAPTSSGGSHAGDEDEDITFVSADFAFADADTGATLNAIKITSLPANGTLKLSGTDVSADQEIAVAEIENLSFTPDADYNGSSSFQYQVSDGIAFSSNATMGLTINAVNDAPVLTGTGSDMTEIDEDDTDNNGQTVESVLATITEADTGTHGTDNGLLQGMAIYSTTLDDQTDGKWQYKIGAGAWTDFEAVSETQALLLKSDDLIRFLPDGKNGQTASFNYYAWDQASGTAGDKVSVATRGDASAFSTASDSVSITVTDINDAPEISVNNDKHTVLEGGLLTLTTTNLNATDVDDDDATLAFIITTAPTQGVLFLDANGNNMADTGEVLAATAGTGVITSFTQGDLAAGLIKYQQTDTLAGSATDYGSDSFDFKVQDGMEDGVTAPSGTHTLTITPVNDAPTLTATASSPTFNEVPGTAVTLFSAAAASTIETVQTITELKLTVSGLGNGADEKLTVDGSTFSLTNATSGTTTTNSVGYTVSVTSSTATVTLTHTGLSTSQAQNLINGLAYRNTSQDPVGTSRVVTLTSIKDNGGTSDGGIDTTAVSIASTVTIISTDTAPILTVNTGANLANGDLVVLSTAMLQTTDPDTANAALVYTLTAAPTKGTLFKDLNNTGVAEPGESLVANSTFTQADIVEGRIKYRHDGEDNTADAFSFTVKDSTTTLNAASFVFSFSEAGNVTGTGSTTAKRTDGTDPLFSGVIITPSPDHTIQTLTFAVTGVKDGTKEILTINGQDLPMQNGHTTTVNGITYTVAESPLNSGNFTVTVTDSTPPGFSGSDANAIVNGVRYTNDAVPPTAGPRNVTLDSVTEMNSAGTPSTPTNTHIVATTTIAPATDLFTVTQAENAIPAPGAGNDIQALSFTVTGVQDGGSEFLKLNGVEIPMAAGTTTLDGVTYTVVDNGSGSFTVTVSDTTPPAFSESEAEAIVNNATLGNNAASPTAGTRTVTLDGVTVANSTNGTVVSTTNPNLSSSTSTTGSGTGTSALSGATLPSIGTDTIDSLTFTVTGVKDGGNEVLTFGTAPDTTDVPLVTGTVASTAPPGDYVVTVLNGTATVVFTPTTNLSEADANTLIQSSTYTNNATPATEGTRTVAVTNMGVEPSGGGTVTATPVTTINSSPIVISGVTVPTLTPGSGTDVFSTDIDLPTVESGKSVKAITLDITGVQDGAKETITINGQTVPLVNGTSITVGDVTYTVTLDAAGNGTLTMTDATAPGWNEAQTENILNNIGYQNTANPPTAGDREIKVGSVTQADNNDWSTTSALTPLPSTATNASTVTVNTAATSTPTGGAGENTSPLFDSVDLPTPTSGSTVSELSFTVTGVKNGEKEIFTVNGQNIPLVPGSTTVDGVTYIVTVDANGTATVRVIDNTPPGFTEAKAEAIVNGAAYTNTANPATEGDRVVSLTGMKEMTAGGVESTVDLTGSTPTPVTVAVSGTNPTTPNPVGSVDLFNGVALDDPGAGNTYKTLTFGVTGVKDGASEVFTVNGQAVPLVNGTVITVGDVTYTVILDANGNGTVSVTDDSAPGFSKTDAEGIVNGATYANSANPVTSGERVISLQSTTVMDGNGDDVGTATTITGVSTSFNPAALTSDVFTSSQTIPTLAGSETVDSLSFGVSGVKDGAHEILVVNGHPVPLAAGTSSDASGNSYAVTVDANGNATVVFTPATNLSETEANALVDGVRYTNTANPPTDGARDISVNSLVKEDSSSPPVQTTVPTPGLNTTVGLGTVTNTAPQVTVNAGLTVDEGQTFTLTATQLAATDAQQSAGSLVFTLTAVPTNGTLFRDNNGNGLVNTGEAIAAGSTFTQSELGSGKIKYRHDSSETARDQLSFTVSDGSASTVATPFVITVNPVDDAPVLTATAENPTVNEGENMAALFSAVMASTGDTLGTPQTLTRLSLTVSNIVDGAHEKLVANGVAIELSGNTTSGAAGQINGADLSYTVSKSGSTATMTFTHSGLSETELKALVEGLRYQNTHTDATGGARAINITQLVDDGSATPPHVNTAHLSVGSMVTLVPLNDPPTLTGMGFTVQEGGAFTLTTTQLLAADPDTPLTDLVYTVSTTPSAGLLYLDRNSNSVNDVGDATLGVNSPFTHTQLINGQVRYQHDGSERGDTLAFKVSDGNSASSPVPLAVTYTPVNDAPVLSGLNGDVLIYPPRAPAMLIDKGSNATVSDPDSANFNGGSLQVSVFFNGDPAKDVLSIKNIGMSAGQIGISGSTVSYAGTPIGTFTGGASGADLVVMLNANATHEATTALIRAIQFYNDDAEPTDNSRGIQITVSDGDGGTSLASQVQITIPVSARPVFLNGSGFDVPENAEVVTTLNASDASGKLPITYSISTATGANNADASQFTMDATSGILRFIDAPDYEEPTDSGGDNVYNIVVRATNSEGAYTEAALTVNVINVVNESGVPPDLSGPVFHSATVNGKTLVMTYTDESPLDAVNIPPTTAFTVSNHSVIAVAVNATAKTVTLTLATAVAYGEAVTVTYADPTTGNDQFAIQDVLGNDAASLPSTPVTNSTAVGGDAGSSGSEGGGDAGTGDSVTQTITPIGNRIITHTVTRIDGGTTTSITTVTPAGLNTTPDAGQSITTSLVSSATGAQRESIITVTLPAAVGLTSELVSGPGLNLREHLTVAANATIQNDPSFRAVLNNGIEPYLQTVLDPAQVVVGTITLTAQANPSSRIIINGALGTGEDSRTHPLRQEAVIIDARNLPPGTVVEVNNIEFAIVIGPVRVTGGEGRNFVLGDDAPQYIVLGEGDDILRGGGGNDTIGSKGGHDRLFGDEGNDYLVGGTGDDHLEGGPGNDVLQGGSSDAGTWRFSLDDQGQMILNFSAQDAHLSGQPSLAITGNWSAGDSIDPRFAFVFADYGIVTDIALLYKAVIRQLPDIAAMNYGSSQGLTASELGALAYEAYQHIIGPQPQALEMQITQLITHVLGEVPQDWVRIGVDYLHNGGQWGDVLLFLARHAHQNNPDGMFKVVQDVVLEETGWQPNAGNNVLLGGAGDDRLIPGIGHSTVDGGEGVDTLVMLGKLEDYWLGLETGAQGTPTLLLRNDLLGSHVRVSHVEWAEIGGQRYGLDGPWTELPPGQFTPLSDFVRLAGQAEASAALASLSDGPF